MERFDSQKAENIYSIKSSGIIDRHFKQEQNKLYELNKRGVLTSSALYHVILNLYNDQLKELCEHYYCSLIESLEPNKSINNKTKALLLKKMEEFITKEINIKKNGLIKKFAIGGIKNKPLSIPYLKKLLQIQKELYHIYKNTIVFEIEKRNREYSKGIKKIWQSRTVFILKLIAAGIVALLTGIYYLLQIIESDTFKDFIK